MTNLKIDTPLIFSKSFSNIIKGIGKDGYNYKKTENGLIEESKKTRLKIEKLRKKEVPL